MAEKRRAQHEKQGRIVVCKGDKRIGCHEIGRNRGERVVLEARE